MKWTVLMFLFVGCTTTVTVAPLKQKAVVHHQKYHITKHPARPQPKPSLVSPAPPDPRMQDVIKAIKP